MVHIEDFPILDVRVFVKLAVELVPVRLPSLPAIFVRLSCRVAESDVDKIFLLRLWIVPVTLKRAEGGFRACRLLFQDERPPAAAATHAFALIAARTGARTGARNEVTLVCAASAAPFF